MTVQSVDPAVSDTEPVVEEPTDAPEESDVEPGYPSVRAGVEAILMVVDEPISTVSLAQALAVPVPVIADTLLELAGEYQAQERGYDLREVAGGWRFYSAPVLCRGRGTVRARRVSRPG